MNAFWRPSRVALLFALIVMIALWSVEAGKELWFSERFVVVMAEQPLPAMLELLRFENNPPFFFVFMKFWKGVVGDHEAFLRLATLIPTLVWLVLLRSLARRIAGEGVAAVTVLLASVSGLVVMQAGELRMYPWLLLWTTIALLSVQILNESQHRGAFVSFTIANILGLYTHYTFIIIFVFLTAWLFVKAPQPRRSLIVSTAISLAIFAPWFFLSLLPIVSDLSSNLGIQTLSAPRWHILQAPFRFLIEPIAQGNSFTSALSIVGYLIVGAAVFQGVLQALRGDAVRRAFLLGLPLIAGLVLTAVGIVLPKYATILLPSALIVISLGLSNPPIPWSARSALVAILMTSMAAVTFQRVKAATVTYRQTASVVQAQEQANDRILIYPFNDELALKPYYKGELPVVGFLALREPQELSLKEVIQLNFRVTTTEENVSRLASYVGDAQRVWFFYDVPPTSGYWNGDLIDQWFSENGFSKHTYSELFESVPPLLVRYDREAEE